VHRRGYARDTILSLSHLEDCVKACLDLWEMRAPFGIYNVTNPRARTARQIALEMRRRLRTPITVENAGGPDYDAAPPGCILDSSKLFRARIKLRPVQEALADCLERMRLTAPPARPLEVETLDYASAL
jgi:nucleoside-diphosphate-sugar epimerase